jgi:hypothetical protein
MPRMTAKAHEPPGFELEQGAVTGGARIRGELTRGEYLLAHACADSSSTSKRTASAGRMVPAQVAKEGLAAIHRAVLARVSRVAALQRR